MGADPHITIAQFMRDMKADADEPGENENLIRECKTIDQFSWGKNSQAAYCLSLACCFYFRVKWVMNYFFSHELERAKQTDLHLFYDNDQLDEGYVWSKDGFAKSFTGYMKEIGAILVDNESSKS